MKERIVVMGGSFNPPTIAHYKLIKAAMQTIDATKGIMVPVGHAYLKRKMRRAEAPLVLEESLRLNMVQAMFANDPNVLVTDVEMRNPSWYTEETLRHYQEVYPDADFYFLVGADKMKLIKHWAEKSDFLDQFGVAIVCREGVDPMEVICQDEHMAKYQDSFILVNQLEGVEDVSSTAIRKAFLTGSLKPVKGYFHEKVWELFRELDSNDYPPEIEKFQGKYEFLSNRLLSNITFEGLTFRCAEAAFQAMRAKNPVDRKRFLTCDSGKAKSIALNVEPREDWEEAKLEVMEQVLRAKFDQHPKLKEKLTATGNTILTFGNNGKDSFWGMDLYTCKGENQLGKLLMKIRSDYQSKG